MQNRPYRPQVQVVLIVLVVAPSLTAGIWNKPFQFAQVPGQERVNIWEVDANTASGGAFQR